MSWFSSFTRWSLLFNPRLTTRQHIVYDGEDKGRTLQDYKKKGGDDTIYNISCQRGLLVGGTAIWTCTYWTTFVVEEAERLRTCTCRYVKRWVYLLRSDHLLGFIVKSGSYILLWTFALRLPSWQPTAQRAPCSCLLDFLPFWLRLHWTLWRDTALTQVTICQVDQKSSSGGFLWSKWWDKLTVCAQLNTGVFNQATEDVTLKYTTPITPAAWALFVWDFIYIWVFAMFIYLLVGLCRR